LLRSWYVTFFIGSGPISNTISAKKGKFLQNSRGGYHHMQFGGTRDCSPLWIFATRNSFAAICADNIGDAAARVHRERPHSGRPHSRFVQF
jgi:hypothetical protein